MRASCSSLWRSSGSLILESPIKPDAGALVARPPLYSKPWGSVWSTLGRLNTQRSTDVGSLQQSRSFNCASKLRAKSLSKSRRRQSVPPSSRVQALAFDKGVPLARHRGPLSNNDLYVIYPRSDIDSEQGLRILQVLHGRRVNGTLDLPLPSDVARLVAGDTRLVTDALSFLRHEYPLDEDVAIIERIKTEEAMQAEEQKVRDRERFRPQSGQFGESRGEKNSAWGNSVLEQIRKRNQEKAKLAEEEDNRMIDLLDENLKREGKPGGLIKVETQDLSVGRPITVEDIKNNVYLKWRFKHSLEAMSHITAEQAASMNMFRRLVPSALFTLLFVSGMYWYSQTWHEPNQMDRLWPRVPLSVATLGGIMIANAAVFLLWKAWPPAWKWLNRYFISVHSWPYALSMLGNTFSHQGARHFFLNMFVLWMVGLRLHEDVDRGSFLAIYLATGVVASFGSMAFSVIRRAFATTSLGASGSLTGIVGAYYTLHSEDKMSIPFLSDDLQRYTAVSGATILAILVAVDLGGLAFVSLFGRNIDSMAHLCGYLVGTISAWWLKKNKTGGEETPKNRIRAWYDKLWKVS